MLSAMDFGLLINLIDKKFYYEIKYLRFEYYLYQ